MRLILDALLGVRFFVLLDYVQHLYDSRDEAWRVRLVLLWLLFHLPFRILLITLSWAL